MKCGLRNRCVARLHGEQTDLVIRMNSCFYPNRRTQRRRTPNCPAAAIAILLIACLPAAALLTSEKGAKELSPANYTDWPGLAAAINDPARVYQVWVNGNEQFFYRGDTAALNRVLKKFSETQTPRLQVILRPGPGPEVELENGERQPADWSLQIVGGIARASITHRGLDAVWNMDPTLTIYLTEGIALADMVIPDPIAVLQLEDLRRRYLEAQKLEGEEIRREAAQFLQVLTEDAEREGEAAAVFTERVNAIAGHVAGLRKKRPVPPQ